MPSDLPRDRAPLWIFGDQLGPHVHSTEEHRGREVVLVESERVFRRRRVHRQKLHLVLSGLRHAAAELGDRAIHLRTGAYHEAFEQVGRPVPARRQRHDGDQALQLGRGVHREDVRPLPRLRLRPEEAPG
jgi:deoxyribodipyrimidine photolyase-related protein